MKITIIDYSFRCFLGLGGCQDTFVLSVIEIIFNPDICRPLIADILPGPMPETRTLTCKIYTIIKGNC